MQRSQSRDFSECRSVSPSTRHSLGSTQRQSPQRKGTNRSHYARGSSTTRDRKGGGSQLHPENSTSKLSSPKKKADHTDAVHVSRAERMAAVNEASLKDNSCTVPLLLILFAECAVIIGVFVVLIVVTSVRMTATTKDLVEQRVMADLRYAHSAAYDPIDANAKLVKKFAAQYRDQTTATGKEYCSTESAEFSASTDFFCDAVSTLGTHPLMTIMYAVTLNQTNTSQVTSECGIGFGYAYTRNSSVYRIADYNILPTMRETRNGLKVFENKTLTFTNRPYDVYIKYGSSYTDFAWRPYIWITLGGRSTMILAGYAPLEVSHTLPDGSLEIFEPNLTQPSLVKINVSQKTLSFVAGEMRLAPLTPILKAITPPAHGAHTSIYDVRDGGLLLSTSVDIKLYDNKSNIWPGGKTNHAGLNEAFRFINPQPMSSSNYEEENLRSHVVFTSERVISSIRISSDSGIDFVVIQSTPIGFYMDAVSSLRTLMIVLGVVAAIVVVAVCVSMVMAIRATISELQDGMELAALLKNDRVVPCRSIMTELDHLCLAFGQMNAKLGAARAFMPQSMLLTDTDPETEGDGDALGGHSVTEGDAVTRSSARSVAKRDDSNVIPSSDDQTGPSTANQHGARRGLNNPWQSEAGLAMKRVTVLSINARGFHAAVAGGIGMGTLTTELTTTVQSLSGQARGVIDSFHGDHFVVSFNAAKTNAQGPAMAAQCALDIATAFASPQGKDTPSLTFAMGVATGRAAVGHLGSNDLKRFSIIGKVFSRATALERLCRRVGEEEAALYESSLFSESHALRHLATPPAIQLLTDGTVAPDIDHSHFLQVLAKASEVSLALAYRNASKRGDGGNAHIPVPDTEIILYAVRGSSCRSADDVGDEWLYELKREGAGGADPVLPAVNRAMLNFLSSVGVTRSSSSNKFTEPFTADVANRLLYPPEALASLQEELRRIELMPSAARTVLTPKPLISPASPHVTVFSDDVEAIGDKADESGDAPARSDIAWGQLALIRALAIAKAPNLTSTFCVL